MAPPRETLTNARSPVAGSRGLFRHLHLVVPPVTIGFAAAALLGFAAPRTVLSVRLWGGATERLGEASVRVDCVRHETGVVDLVPLTDMELSVSGQKQTIACPAAGSVEVPLRLDGAPLQIRVARGKTLLAEGLVSVSPAAARARAQVRSARLLRTTFAGMKATAYVPGGSLVLGDASTVLVEVRAEGEAFAPLACPKGKEGDRGLRTEGNGLDVHSFRCGPSGYEFRVVPQFVTASLAFADRTSPESFRFEAQIPVTAAPRLDDLRVEGDRVVATVRTALSTASLHARIEDAEGGRFAARVPMSPAPRSGSWGTLSLPLLRSGQRAGERADQGSVVIVGTEDGVASSSRAVRLPPSELSDDVALAPPTLWLDGSPALLRAEGKRTGEARTAVGFLLIMGALFEALLVFRRSRASAREFRAHLAAASRGTEGELGRAEAEELEDRSGLSGLLVALVAILFGFAIIAVLVFAKPS